MWLSQWGLSRTVPAGDGVCPYGAFVSMRAAADIFLKIIDGKFIYSQFNIFYFWQL